MEELRKLEDRELVAKVCALAREERRITELLLAHIDEVERRRLHLARGYGSLHRWVCEELGYSSDQAQYRIDAMRALRAMPEARSALEQGRISLTHLVKAQRFFEQEKEREGVTYSDEEKRELLEEMEGTTTRECERLLAERSPLPLILESTQPVAGGMTKITITVSAEVMARLDKLRALWGCRSYEEVVARMARVTVEKEERKRKPLPPRVVRKPEMLAEAEKKRREREKGTVADSVAPQVVEVEQVAGYEISMPGLTRGDGSPPEVRVMPKLRDLIDLDMFLDDGPLPEPPADLAMPESRYIPSAIRRQIWERDEGKCAFLSETTGKRCCSTFNLEIDHIIPYALGGNHDLDNLRLVCRAHNEWYAENIFGEEYYDAGKKH